MYFFINVVKLGAVLSYGEHLNYKKYFHSIFVSYRPMYFLPNIVFAVVPQLTADVL